MRAPKALERLLRVRGVEEEQRRLSLETAAARLKSLQKASEAALESEKQGRSRQTVGMISGSIADRQAGVVEEESARRRALSLKARIVAAEQEAAARRREYLEKRVERRQAEILVEKAAAREELESGRKTQQQVDDWYGARNHRQAADECS